jgi:predicted Rossmann fold nucleotide-binding protein DprA/Smf involved in DNA uptake
MTNSAWTGDLMKSVSLTTSSRREPRLAEPTRRVRRAAPAGGAATPTRIEARLRAALARAQRPVRARALAHDLGLPAAEVTAELRRLQDLGIATSHDRRWSIARANTKPADDAAGARKTA